MIRRFIAAWLLNCALAGGVLIGTAYGQSAPSASGFTGNPLVSNGQHMIAGGSANPAASSGCGTGAQTFGFDVAGKIKMGTGSTSCTITWAQAYLTAPTCIVTGEISPPSYQLNPTPLTSLVINNPVDGAVYDWHCIGRP